jgi:hypothetical protein
MDSPSKLAALVVVNGAGRTWKEAAEPVVTAAPAVSTDIAPDEQDTYDDNTVASTTLRKDVAWTKLYYCSHRG